MSKHPKGVRPAVWPIATRELEEDHVRSKTGSSSPTGRDDGGERDDSEEQRLRD